MQPLFCPRSTGSDSPLSCAFSRLVSLVEVRQNTKNNGSTLSESTMTVLRVWTLILLLVTVGSVVASDTNHVYGPCSDTKVERSDGFTFGIAFASRNSFFLNTTQLSPCDRRLTLSNSNSQIAVFRPKVDEISLLTVNSSSFSPVSSLYPILCKLL